MDVLLAIATYLTSVLTMFAIFIFAFDLPTLMGIDKKLVTERYYMNFTHSLYFTSMIYVAGFLFVAQVIISALSAQSLLYRLFIVAVVTGLISAIFLWVVDYGLLDGKSFFSRWFKNAGIKAVTFDIIIVTTVYLKYWMLNRHIQARRAGYSSLPSAH